jgi:REP element-mobilizing transposase RayT
MPYTPTLHHRRSIRLKGYDYSQSGLYFVTVCVQKHECLFGKIVDGEMILNEYGKMVEKCLLEIPQHFPNAVLHEFIVMPNHLHAIIELTNDDAATFVGAKNFSPKTMPTPVKAKNFSPLPSQPLPEQSLQRPCGTSRTIGSIVRGVKIGVTKQIGYSIWQRNYHEHIIRNEQSYQRIANYIINNSTKWENDKFYIK